MKILLSFTILISVLCCTNKGDEGTKSIDTGKFEIQVPNDWKYKNERGIDSFVGRIIGNGIDLNFDWSEMGYANHLIPTEKEYVYENDWEWMPMVLPYAKEGVIYTSGNVQGEKKRIMKEKGISDTSLVKVEPFQIPDKEIRLEKNQYSAVLTYKDTAINMKIEIPEEIKNHIIQVDTIGQYRRKIIRPRNDEDGLTGVYFEDLRSGFNFNLAGKVEGKVNQNKAIRSFKTIKIKRESN